MINPSQDNDVIWYACEKSDGSTYRLEGVEDEMESGQMLTGLAEVDEDSRTVTVTSGEYVLSEHTNGVIASVEGVKPLLIVYVDPPDEKNGKTKEEYANDVFGICDGCATDPVNLKSQMSACSAGKLQFIPAKCPTGATSCQNRNLIVNGAITVSITQNIGNVASGTVVNYAQSALNTLLSDGGLQVSDYSSWYKLFIFSTNANWGGAAAWAYLPGVVSAYRDDYAYRMGVLVHELGHNIGLHHSGSGSASYADHSCLMGNPSYGDDGPQICFNGAKNWETSWFSDDSETVNVLSGKNWDGMLVGIDDYSKNKYSKGTHYMVIKIPDDAANDDLYVMYNKKKGINGGVTFDADKVTITRGQTQQVSWRQGALDTSTNLYTSNNFGTSRKTLNVKLCEFSTNSASTDTARVLVYTNDNPLSCESSTSAPIKSPTKNPTKRPTANPTRKPTTVPTRKPTTVPTKKPTSAPTKGSSSSPNPTGDNDPRPLSWTIEWLSPVTVGSSATGTPVMKVKYESSNRDYDIKLFHDDCIKPLPTSVIPMLSSSSNAEPKGFINVDVDLTMNQADIEDSDIWIGNEDGTGGSFSFCMSKSLYWDSSLQDDSRATKKDIILHVTVDNQADFSTGEITIAAEEAGQADVSIVYEGTVEAYLCDDTYNELSQANPLGPFDIMNVCVAEKDDTAVVVKGIQDLTLTQEGTGAMFAAVTGGSTPDAYTDLVDVKCNGTVCMGRVHLISAFFAEVRPLIVNGKVTLGDGQRKLNVSTRGSMLRGGQKTKRNLQEDDEFTLKVELAQPCEGRGNNLLSNLLVR